MEKGALLLLLLLVSMEKEIEESIDLRAEQMELRLLLAQ
jgi:hypothetical protein